MIKPDHIAFIGLAAGLAAGLGAGAAGCTPSDTSQIDSRDVAALRNDGATRNDAATAPPDARRSAGDRGRYEIELAQAEGNHRFAIEKCRVLTDAQARVCRAQADADYEMLKSIADHRYPHLASAR